MFGIKLLFAVWFRSTRSITRPSQAGEIDRTVDAQRACLAGFEYRSSPPTAGQWQQFLISPGGRKRLRSKEEKYHRYPSQPRQVPRLGRSTLRGHAVSTVIPIIYEIPCNPSAWNGTLRHNKALCPSGLRTN